MLFISYSRTDKDLVLPFVKTLRAAGQEVFVDVESLQYGEKWELQLCEAISRAERFLLFWSRASANSPYVKQECELALKNSGCVLVPIMLDKTPLPGELSRLHGSEELQSIVARWRKERSYKTSFWSLVPILGVMAFYLVSPLFNKEVAYSQSGLAQTDTRPSIAAALLGTNQVLETSKSTQATKGSATAIMFDDSSPKSKNAKSTDANTTGKFPSVFGGELVPDVLDPDGLLPPLSSLLNQRDRLLTSPQHRPAVYTMNVVLHSCLLLLLVFVILRARIAANKMHKLRADFSLTVANIRVSSW